MTYDEAKHAAMVEKALDAIPGYPFLPCPICRGVEGCDHTVVERAEEYEVQHHGWCHMCKVTNMTACHHRNR